MIFLSQKELISWLEKILQKRILVAPKDVGRGHIHYRRVENTDEIAFEYTRPDLSAKEFLFPHTDRLMRIVKKDDQVTINTYLPEKEQVIFGLRPCDAHGMLAFDALFLERDPIDTHYSRRRELTTLVGMACPTMWENCFCTSLGGAPDDSSHVDILLTALDAGTSDDVNEKGYAVQAVTEKGVKLLEMANTATISLEHLPEIPLNDRVPIVPVDEWPAHFNEEYWLRLGERCLSCKLCTFICPTCRCFDLRDEPLASGANVVIYERMRVWDACTAPNYRTIAGGHNSRPKKGQRIRNRYYCKFNYYPKDFGAMGCVGCGRCIDACPVNIDIIEMLNAVNAMQQELVALETEVS